MNGLIEKLDRPAIIFVLVLTTVVCGALLLWREAHLGGAKDTSFVPFDRRIGYSVQEFHTDAGSLSPESRRLYAYSALSADVLFPLAYAPLLSLLLFKVTVPRARGTAVFGLMLLLPAFAAAADLVENGSIAAILLNWADFERLSALVRVASAATVTKWACLAVWLAMLGSSFSQRMTAVPHR